jgi:hypothetical protein
MVYWYTKNHNLGIPTFEGLGIENVGIFYRHLSDFYVHLADFVVNWYVYFARFGVLFKKNLATLLCRFEVGIT